MSDERWPARRRSHAQPPLMPPPPHSQAGPDGALLAGRAGVAGRCVFRPFLQTSVVKLCSSQPNPAIPFFTWKMTVDN